MKVLARSDLGVCVCVCLEGYVATRGVSKYVLQKKF